MDNKLKKTVACALAALSSCAVFACAPDAPREYKTYMPDGAPAIALSALMDSGYDGMEFTVVPAAAIEARVSTGDADFAILPINTAATLYNGGTDIVMLSVNTHGNLYVIGNGDAISLSDLKGKRLGVIGQAKVPDLTMRMLFAEAGVEYVVSASAVENKVAVTYAADGQALAPKLKKGELDYAFLAEPAATMLSGTLGTTTVLDVQAEWKRVFGGEYPQACLVVKKSILNKDKKYVKDFLAALKGSDGWAEENAEKAVEAVNEHMEKNTEMKPMSLSAPVIKRCNISTVYANDAKAACESYFARLYELVDDTLGTAALDKAPSAGFYYKG